MFSPMTFREGVKQFWNWFARNERRLYDAIKAKQCPSLEPETSEAVSKWLGALPWCYGPGLTPGQHSFTLSPGGILHRQFLTKYWLKHSPELSRWNFHSSIQAGKIDPMQSIDVGGHEFRIGEMWVSAVLDDQDENFDIVVWHPNFIRIPLDRRQLVTYLWLDKVLGEHGTMQWIGQIDCNEGTLKASFPMTELKDLIARTKENYGWHPYPPGEEGIVYQLSSHSESAFRGDIVVGATSNFGLIQTSSKEDPLKGTGAQFLFAVLDVRCLEPGNESGSRGLLEDALEIELEREASGQVLGGATGTKYSYIDVVAFDARAAANTMTKSLTKAMGRGFVSVNPFF